MSQDRCSCERRAVEESRHRIDDEALLVAAARGDGGAFELFYRRWLPGVTRFHLRRVGSRELAFDLTAETFAGLVVALGDFDPARGSAPAWLFGIAEHKLHSSFRRGRVEARARRALGHASVVLDDEDLARVEELASVGQVPELDVLLGELPAGQEAAVRARVLDERSYAEIAVDLECSEAVVRQRVHRGLERLRERLAEAS
jgi:RNA polymerase sigma factor (sigma-70 family)